MDDPATEPTEPTDGNGTGPPAGLPAPPAGQRHLYFEEVRPFFRPEAAAEVELALTRYQLAAERQRNAEPTPPTPNRAARRATKAATKKRAR